MRVKPLDILSSYILTREFIKKGRYILFIANHLDDLLKNLEASFPKRYNKKNIENKIRRMLKKLKETYFMNMREIFMPVLIEELTEMRNADIDRKKIASDEDFLNIFGEIF